MTLLTPNLMLTLINTAYYGVTQFFPGVVVILFKLRVRSMAVALGILCGQVLAIAMYFMQPDFGGFNIGLVSLAANLMVMLIANLLMSRSVSRAEIA